jgi:cytochrome c oxidase assembly protein subunit 15
LAGLLACATFPLIWVGGLVTTYDAGMAVPDWPSTYGYNLFLYPWQTWLAAPWDLFIEHGHRLLGAAVGLLAIALVAAVWFGDRRVWMWVAAWTALILVVVQGILGGQRVLEDARSLAQAHAIVGPVFLGFCAFLIAATSRWWQTYQLPAGSHHVRDLEPAAWFAVLLAVLQLVFGSQLRHVDAFTSRDLFGLALALHIGVAGAFLLQAVYLAAKVLRQLRGVALIARPVLWLTALVTLQVFLGLASWVVKYGWPAFVRDLGLLPPLTVQAEGFFQSMTVTAHVAIGALILATSACLAVRVSRLGRTPEMATSVDTVHAGVAG